ncbi:SOS response-associated peptidase [Algoriphagus aestuariicola]|jgi:putative SOS response-associated peptidase YedK|uniref:Abasic site processing protein n=1 Tax=Algoriphagus aestuariicola TaxID=1852016 RepID=A0ABS3BL95_9BACT|nr:SOS response-associated peptidase [Algoriphagus aestuariicola]MBN7800065.1 SOS response-associated peptidase [Algoriphagus aestuariicola]
MCFYFFSDDKWLADLSTDELYGPWVKQLDAFEGEHYNIGFAHPRLDVLTNDFEKPIAKMEWGLLPHWSKDKSFQKNTLNARLETLEEKPSFRSYTGNRCLIPAESFVEWQWLDPKGKTKQKYRIREKGEPWFTFAGIYSNWTDPDTGEIIPTFSIVTREAEGIMREIHNTKLRMPMLVSRTERDLWLAGELDVATPPELEAEKAE